jgi:hypothetical protein
LDSDGGDEGMHIVLLADAEGCTGRLDSDGGDEGIHIVLLGDAERRGGAQVPVRQKVALIFKTSLQTLGVQR